ncbi:hypothetical protein [Halorussus pelagicus]|uniref:hypothetical protein n=1 Tax=Halorussus pelagicus TaxID=2505977 RepID=UPI000FFBA748|nr:hypothetical protein [Halorussus pelagicus]
MGEGESRRRRDFLRAGAVAGLVAFGWSAGGASGADRTAATANQQTTDGERTTDDQRTTTQDAESAYAFSYDLQQGDRFRVESRLRTAEDDPATETIPATCLDGGSREFAAFVVRAYRSDIQFGYEGLFVPPTVSATATEAAMQDETTTRAGNALPEIRLGEWYRVASMSKCDSLSRLSLEPAASPTTALGPKSR